MKKRLYILLLIIGICFITGCSSKGEESSGKYIMKCSNDTSVNLMPTKQELELHYVDGLLFSQHLVMEIDLTKKANNSYYLYRKNIDDKFKNYSDIENVKYKSQISNGILKVTIDFNIDDLSNDDLKALEIPGKTKINNDYKDFIKQGYKCEKNKSN